MIATLAGLVAAWAPWGPVAAVVGGICGAWKGIIWFCEQGG